MKLFNEFTKGTISDGTGADTGLNSSGPRRDTDKVRRFKGLIVLSAIKKASIADKTKKPNPTPRAILEIFLKTLICPFRVCATETNTSFLPICLFTVTIRTSTSNRVPKENTGTMAVLVCSLINSGYPVNRLASK